MKLKPVSEQVVVVFGANSGIGRASALRFAQEGARVVLGGRSLAPLNELADEINRQGGTAAAVEADASVFEQVRNLADRAVALYGRIDTWVHLPAVTLYAPFQEITPEEFRRVIEVNLVGQAYGALAALPHLRLEGRGALIHVSSIEGRRAVPLHSPYTASKHGVVGFVDALRMELEKEGVPISVTNVLPASINTPLFDKALTRLGVKPRPMPPIYEPEVVAEVIVYAAGRPVRDIYGGGAGKAFGLLNRISPRLGDKLLLPVAFAGQKTDEPKGPEAPNNLFAHLEGFDRAEGSFGQEAKSFSIGSWYQTNPAAKAAAVGLLLAAGMAVGAFMASRAGYLKALPAQTRRLFK